MPRPRTSRWPIAALAGLLIVDLVVSAVLVRSRVNAGLDQVERLRRAMPGALTEFGFRFNAERSALDLGEPKPCLMRSFLRADERRLVRSSYRGSHVDGGIDYLLLLDVTAVRYRSAADARAAAGRVVDGIRECGPTPSTDGGSLLRYGSVSVSGATVRWTVTATSGTGASDAKALLVRDGPWLVYVYGGCRRPCQAQLDGVRIAERVMDVAG